MLWKKLETESDLVVLMRHTQPAGGKPLTWDESGNCKGESMLTASGADCRPPRLRARGSREPSPEHRSAHDGTD
jgi:hypothetical protein